MNSFYKVSELMKELLEKNEDVHTILLGRTEDMDVYKKNIYPLIHINPLSSSFSSSQINVFNFQVASLSQRDLSKLPELDKFYTNDNLQDNLNLTHSILNRLVSELRLLNNNDMIELVSVSDATRVIYSDHNLLDGWLLNVSISCPNNIVKIC